MAGKLALRVRGLSEAEFQAAYGTEEKCRTVVEQLRWPDGFVCPLCGGTEGTRLGTRPKIQCRDCRRQTSLIAGTIFHATKLPLTTWFLAIWLIATAKNGISSVELGRRLGIRQTNAWALKQKIMTVMAERDGKKPLTGRLEMDDAHLGGHRPGKRGRGAAGKQPFVAAVSTSDGRRPRKIKLLCRSRASGGGRSRGSPPSTWPPRAASSLTGSTAGRRSRRPGTSTPPWRREAVSERPASWSPFKWVNTTLGNIKAAIAGTYRRISPEHAGRHLASFAWCYNRRLQLDSLIPRLVHSAVRTKPMPYRLLIAS